MRSRLHFARAALLSAVAATCIIASAAPSPDPPTLTTILTDRTLWGKDGPSALASLASSTIVGFHFCLFAKYVAQFSSGMTTWPGGPAGTGSGMTDKPNLRKS